MSTGARGVVLERPGSFRLAEHAPRPPGPGEAQVRVAAVGVCGSDREVYQGSRPAGYVRYPVTPGHEWSGTVTAVGEGVPSSLVGRKTVGEGFRNCQVCERCHAGETTLCDAGYEETGFTLPGAMAPTLTLPARLLHPLPDDADLTAAALLEPAACAAAAALRAAVRPGQRVAVVGTGALGMLAAQLLAASSPGDLLMVGLSPDAAPLAGAFGATRYRTADEPAADNGTFDVVVEAAGAPTTARTCAALLRRGGRLVLTGIPAPGAYGLDPTDLVVRQLEVRTVFGATPEAWAHAVRAFACGLLTPLPLVTHELPLDGFEQAMALVGSGDPGVGKVLLRP
ncbi:zinc-binding dehydrogenase [Streptomyces zhihengii]|uniref:2-deoxy-scyllo-inosamine dehydrogenase n=1 Tax=Streptomyces zhihengii TaxID=1818004 RepID=A0ABS2V0B1_9ACTN|nr:alcohol dehydrogenase catalytic domain-containing protein [Streptomyces zhihengii]MBM9623285.1 alcohol dehydrogenase catalytic domain-containing protein [Streptomyces zhihengii]